jgi:predicted alpha/beta hydrolase
MTAAAPRERTLVAADGYRLAATRFDPPGPPRGQWLVAGATGVPQGFYRRFAQWGAAQGWTVWTLDYRGIGRSAPATLRGFRMDYRDWARLDLAALVAEAAREGGPRIVVGHSYGGHAYGLLPDLAPLHGLYTFATGAGWHGHMPPLERLRVAAMWRLLGPLLTRWKGYLPWSMLGMGEDLPLDVYRQWRQWCSRPRYFFDDPAVAGEARAAFARVNTPVVAVNALDDHWARPASRQAFMSTAYGHLPWRAVDVDPAREGLGPIGHMGYFRPAAAPLWQAVHDWAAALPRPAANPREEPADAHA